MVHDSDVFATGGCACGAVRYRLADAPYVVHCCHCTDCQREIGSAFALNAAIESTLLVAEGATPHPDHLPSASGRGQVVMRCPQCHTAMWSYYGVLGNKVAYVRVGTLDNPALCPPSVHIFLHSKQAWIGIDPATPAFDAGYAGSDVVRIMGESGAARLRAVRAG